MNRAARRAQIKQQHRMVERLSHDLESVPERRWPDSWSKGERPTAVWRSRKYLVQAFEEEHGVVRLSVCRSKMGASGRWHDGISWDELQTIKAEVGFGDNEAVELYPPDDDVVNVANMRHLWVLPEGKTMAFGWRKDG